MRVIDTALQIATGLLSVPSLVCCTQVLLALPARRERDFGTLPRPRIAVLMPAHDEAAGIAESLHSIIPQLHAGDRLLVVADNCSDATAAIAAGLGAEVAERWAPDRRGKGYALDFGLRCLELDPPEVVIIVDADCVVHAEALDRLGRLAILGGRPAQALYLMHSPASAGPGARLAEFAWLVRNRVRPLGFSRLGLPCQLTGSGMAFPWPLAQQMQIAHAGIVEDLQLGIDLAIAGQPPVFCPEALVSSEFPVDRAAVGSQRTRWEHGHLGMILDGVPRLLVAAIARRDGRLLGLALDLAVPPLALLTLLSAALCAAGGIAWLAGATPALAGLTALPLAILLLAIVAAWLGWGRRLVPLRSLLGIPLYIAAKIPLYLRFLGKRQTTWVRTGRD